MKAKPSGKSLRKALSDSWFDPRKPGILTVITSTAEEFERSDDLLLARAVEFIKHAQHFDGHERRAKLRDAVAVLAYCMAKLPVNSGSDAKEAPTAGTQAPHRPS